MAAATYRYPPRYAGIEDSSDLVLRNLVLGCSGGVSRGVSWECFFGRFGAELEYELEVGLELELKLEFELELELKLELDLRCELEPQA